MNRGLLVAEKIPSSSDRRSDNVVRRLTMLFVGAVLVNYPWERLQSSLYVHPGGVGIPWWLCRAASLVDGLFFVVIFGVDGPGSPNMV